ncbi:MAG: lytic polysaccharide monooxygenase [Oligoflexales bacterium]|nr:lytic polysaccharide monooxygenase [Oligoflexales bacterium]
MQKYSMLKFRLILATILFCAFYSLPTELSAHARLKSGDTLSPRNNNPGLKTGPCGGVARTNRAKEFLVGQKINIQWEETINHPGRYEFYFSKANDEDFILLKTVIDEQNTRIVNANYHQYETEITLPLEACEACTIQMIQVMTENPSNPSLYFSCADIKLILVEPTDPPVSPEPPVVPPTEPEPIAPTPEEEQTPKPKEENKDPLPEEKPNNSQDAKLDECH